MKIDIKEFTGKCSCERDHQLVVDDVILEEGAIKKLPEILKKEPYDLYKHLVMVCDDNTYEAAGKEGKFKLKDHVDIEADLIEKTFTNKELCESIKKPEDIH